MMNCHFNKYCRFYTVMRTRTRTRRKVKFLQCNAKIKMKELYRLYICVCGIHASNVNAIEQAIYIYIDRQIDKYIYIYIYICKPIGLYMCVPSTLHSHTHTYMCDTFMCESSLCLVSSSSPQVLISAMVANMKVGRFLVPRNSEAFSL